MIVGKMASYPARQNELVHSVNSVLPQVDKLVLCLNEYDSVPDWVQKESKIEAVIPQIDLKDVGKFLPFDDAATHIFFFDDDIIYPADYVSKTRTVLDQHDNVVVGYHGSYFVMPKFGITLEKLKRWIGLKIGRHGPDWYRVILDFTDHLAKETQVEQLGTGVLAMKASSNPPLSYFEGSQMYVDVRFACWCFENGISMLCLPRESGWLIDQRAGDSIYDTFTHSTPKHVRREMFVYAGKSLRLTR